MSTIRVGNIGPLTGNTSVIADPGGVGGMSLVSMGAVSASGTAVDFTGIPSWVRKITFAFINLQKSGSVNNLLQIGTSSGIETTGYVARTAYTGDSGSASITSTSGFVLTAGDAASTCLTSGVATIINITGNQWAFATTGSRTESSYGITGGGNKTLSGTLTRVRLTTNGSETYSGGQMTLYYE